MEIGTLLRKLRDRMRISSRDLAKMIGVSHSTYLDWEHDKTSPSLRSYMRLAGAMGISPVELMAYLTQQTPEIAFGGDRNNVFELREMIAHIHFQNTTIMEINQRMFNELSRVQELQRNS